MSQKNRIVVVGSSKVFLKGITNQAVRRHSQRVQTASLNRRNTQPCVSSPEHRRNGYAGFHRVEMQ